MSNLLKSLFVLIIFCTRLFIIFKITIVLYNTYNNQSNTLNELQWYICALLLDLYLMNLENHLSSDIYNKKNDGQETNTGDK